MWKILEFLVIEVLKVLILFCWIFWDLLVVFVYIENLLKILLSGLLFSFVLGEIIKVCGFKFGGDFGLVKFFVRLLKFWVL